VKCQHLRAIWQHRRLSCQHKGRRVNIRLPRMSTSARNLATLRLLLATLQPKIGNPGRKLGNPMWQPCQNGGSEHKSTKSARCMSTRGSQTQALTLHTDFPDCMHSLQLDIPVCTHCPGQVRVYRPCSFRSPSLHTVSGREYGEGPPPPH
jgi:hypothetical protein